VGNGRGGRYERQEKFISKSGLKRYYGETLNSREELPKRVGCPQSIRGRKRRWKFENTRGGALQESSKVLKG